MLPGEITYLDLRPDSWQSYIEREEYMESSADKLAKMKARAEALDAVLFGRMPEQAKLLLAPAASTHGATCAKCGRVFTTAAQYRYRGPRVAGRLHGSRFVAASPLPEPAAPGQSVVFYLDDELAGLAHHQS